MPSRLLSDKADASDAHQNFMCNRCLNPGDVFAQEACRARFRASHRLQMQSRPPRLAFCGTGFLAPLVRWTRRLSTLTGSCSGLVAVREIVCPQDRAAADVHLPD